MHPIMPKTKLDETMGNNSHDSLTCLLLYLVVLYAGQNTPDVLLVNAEFRHSQSQT